MKENCMPDIIDESLDLPNFDVIVLYCLLMKSIVKDVILF